MVKDVTMTAQRHHNFGGVSFRSGQYLEEILTLRHLS